MGLVSGGAVEGAVAGAVAVFIVNRNAKKR